MKKESIISKICRQQLYDLESVEIVKEFKFTHEDNNISLWIELDNLILKESTTVPSDITQEKINCIKIDMLEGFIVTLFKKIDKYL